MTLIIVTRFAIEAAHQAALTEHAYRYCRVYGMGSRKRWEAR